MPKLSEKAIDEFQILWKENFRVELTYEEAVSRAHQVFELVQMLMENPKTGDI